MATPMDRKGSVAQELPLGAHLVTPRLGYLHHGIYAGAGRVIHYAGFKELLCRGPVEEISLEEFADGHELRVQARAAPRFEGAACVARARSRLGENSYRFLSNNCEHFVEWCITGIARSAQIEALEFARNALLGLVAAALMAGCA